MAARVSEPPWEAAVTTEEERDAELEEALSVLRPVKDDREIVELRKAVDSSVRGFTDGSISRTVPVGAPVATAGSVVRASRQGRPSTSSESARERCRSHPDGSTAPQEWPDVGIRIQDNLVVADHGHENLSGSKDEVDTGTARFAG